MTSVLTRNSARHQASLSYMLCPALLIIRDSQSLFGFGSLSVGSSCPYLCFDPGLSLDGLTHFFNYPKHPQSKGFLERFNQPVLALSDEVVASTVSYLSDGLMSQAAREPEQPSWPSSRAADGRLFHILLVAEYG